MIQIANNPSLSDAEHAAISEWLQAFSAAVRARDFDAGRQLCSHDIFSFGTVSTGARGIDQLEAVQWRKVWKVTSGFRFDLSRLQCGGGAGSYWAAVPWSSNGVRPSGETFERRGRATIILQSTATGLRAIHTHMSLEPNTSPSTANNNMTLGAGRAS